MIDQQTRQRILDSAQILDVVSDFISLRRQGVSYVGLCPFHSDRNPSFYVNPAKNICKCFSCGEGGTPLNFIMKHEQLSYSDALKYLAKKYNIEVVEREESEEEKQRNSERESLFIINDYAAKYFQTQLTETEEGRTVGLAYFRERGIRPETIERFGLGYAPESKTAFTEQAIKSGYPLKRLAEVGLSIEYEDHPGKAIDRFRGRVIFPVRNLSGRYVAFGGRVMSKTAKTAKYVNSPESLIYSKSRELYGLYWAKSAISKLGKCYLVEGYTDVLSMYQAGIENVVSSSGTALTIDQIRLIRRFTTTITVLYDGDAAGIKAALRGIDLLLEEGFRIKVVLLPDGEDPDSFARSHSNTELQAYLDEHETDFIHFKIELYQEEMERDPLRRAELISDLREIVDEVGEPESFEEEDRDMVRSVLDLGHTLVREVMVPRTDMVTIDADTPAPSALRLFVRSGFSRIPVVGDDVDDIRGILFFKDLVSRWEANGGQLDLRAEQMMRPAEYAVEMKLADDMLRQMQAERFHMAIVIDEYGGVAGLVTLEDILEEVVGELTDEHDRHSIEPEETEPGTWRVPARYPISELGELLGRDIEDEDVDSVGGLLAKAIGKVPLPGATGTLAGVMMTAEEARGRRRQVSTILCRLDPDAQLLTPDLNPADDKDN